MEECLQQGQERLCRIEREEGDKPADKYANHAPQRVKRMQIPRGCIRQRC
jgi:hypothetical protein